MWRVQPNTGRVERIGGKRVRDLRRGGGTVGRASGKGWAYGFSLGMLSKTAKKLYLGFSFGQIDDGWGFCLGQEPLAMPAEQGIGFEDEERVFPLLNAASE